MTQTRPLPRLSFAKPLRILALLGALQAATVPAIAQQGVVLEGSVRDTSGAAIEGASVVLRQGAAEADAARTDETGRYRLEALAPGAYRLETGATGFSPDVREINLAGDTSVDVELSIADLAESVTVTAQIDGYAAETATTGTKLTLPRLETPQSISVVSRELMEDRVAIRLTDAADNVAGVRALTGYGGTQSNNYSFRGFESDFTGINLRNGFAEYSFLSQRDPANVERVEFLKGPSSLLYGVAEVGGLVNTVTKKPLSQHHYELGFTGGGFGQIRPTLDFTGPLNASRTLLFRLNAAYDRGDSYRDLVNHENMFAAPAVTWRPGSATAITFEVEAGRFVNDFDRGFPQNPIFLAEDFSRNYAEPWSRIRNDQVNFMVNATHQFSENWSFRTGFSHLRQQTNSDVTSFGFFALDLDGRTINRSAPLTDEHSRNYNSQNEVYGRFKTGSVEHQVVVGGEYARYAFRFLFDTRTLAPIDRINPVYGALPGFRLFGFNDDSVVNQVGLYAQDQIALTKRLRILIGGRFSNAPLRRNDFATGELLNEQTDRDFLPRAGVTYQVLPGGNAYFSYSNSFFPNFAARQRNGEPFKPTLGTQYEAGWKQQLARGRVLATFAYFDLTKEDVLVPDPEDDTFTFSIQVGEQRSRGAEVEVTGRITQSWNVVATYTALDTEVTEDSRGSRLGSRLVNTPVHSGSLYMNYAFQKGALAGFSMGAGVYAAGARFAAIPNPAWEVPGRARADLNFGYERPHWRFDVAVKNLTKIRDFQLGGFNSMLPLPTRHALASVKYRF